MCPISTNFCHVDARRAPLGSPRSLARGQLKYGANWRFAALGYNSPVLATIQIITALTISAPPNHVAEEPKRALESRVNAVQTVARDVNTRTRLEPLYLEHPDLELAYRSFKRGNVEDARQRLRNLLSGPLKSSTKRVARWLLIRSLESQQSGRKSTEWLQHVQALANDPELAGPVHYRLADYWKNRGEHAKAITHYDQVPANYIRALQARISSVRLLLRLGKASDALAVIRRANPMQYNLYSRQQLILLEAESLRVLGKKSKAIELLYVIWSNNPNSPQGKRAEKALRTLRARPTSAERLVQAFASVNKATQDSLRGRLRKMRRKYRQSGKHAFSFAKGVIESVSSKTRRSSLRHLKHAATSPRMFVAGYALLRLAAALDELERPSEALTTLETLTRKYPAHPAAAEAITRASALARRLRQRKRADQLLEMGDKRYSEHPGQLKYRWKAAWQAWRTKRFKSAVQQFSAIAQDFGPRRHLGQATWFERATYWQANSELELGHLPRAVELWSNIVRNFPLSYYSHQAFNRLMEHKPAIAKQTRPFPRLDRYDIRSPSDLSELEIDITDPGVRHAAFLTRCGLFQDALDDLTYRTRTGRLSPDGVSLLISLAIRLGQVETRRALSWSRGGVPQYPNNVNLKLWQNAYPLPFWDDIQKAAKRFSLSPWLIIALIRHESRYKIKAYSRSKAIGLMQLLVSTARTMADRMAPEVGRITRKTLQLPEVNITLGSAFLSGLKRVFKNNPALMLAAYNAGPGRVKGWWRQSIQDEQLRTDVLVEEIPYRETQSYVKSVIASYGVYRFLYGDRQTDKHRTVPIDMELPSELGLFYSKVP